MARVEVPVVVLNPTTGLPVNGASVAIAHRSSGAAATWFPSETGGAGSTAAVITDANGRVAAWVERGAYNLTISGTGLTTYVEPWDAAPGGDSTIDSAWIPNSGIATAKIADSAVTLAKFAAGTATRILAIGQVGAGNVSAASNTTTSIGDLPSVTHNGKQALILVAALVTNTGGATGGTAIGVRRDAVSVGNVVSADLASGAYEMRWGIYDAGVQTGARVWGAYLQLGNNPTTVATRGLGLVAVFEQI